ncbi:Set1 complex component spp1 [Colletotrichum orbiculare MAFF 240422]|uniref:Set1 complex component spp1 n=1 Tax=Colletotrichum orbiculare (strain 104-T / ATCC 96160 / CBS 514.97 / LARS 414 / MAFF 240422) TaxID=1213857 RepID=N4VFN9_COLOR|nr:Set1 complex component spp1 [Colletotrichum orbiculare MAFF 240422]
MGSEADQPVDSRPQDEDEDIQDAAPPTPQPPTSIPGPDASAQESKMDGDEIEEPPAPTGLASNESDNTILETTEKPVEPTKPAPKKRGTAAIKKPTKRAKNAKATKSRKATSNSSVTNSTTVPDDLAAGDSDDNGLGITEELDESDNGPYCICRGPDDHSFMIGCEICEDWFHGRCVEISKDVGENIIERFVCPNCTDKDNFTLFKFLCSVKNCKKAARRYGEKKSDFCSDEHAQQWWTSLLASQPTGKGAFKIQNTSGCFTREEIMALLNSDLAGVDPADGRFKINTRPFQSQAAGAESPDSKTKNPAQLTKEETELITESSADRRRMGEETALNGKMLQLVEMANDHRKSLIAAKQLEDGSCGYDFRLDNVGAVGPFETWYLNSGEAGEVFKAGKLDAAATTGDGKPVCDKKRCKQHQGWYGTLTRTVRQSIKILAEDAKQRLQSEKSIKDAASERALKKASEKALVQRVNADGTLSPAY